MGGLYSGCKIIEGIECPTSCLDALEISLLFCYTLTCNCLTKAMCHLKRALKMGASQISYFEACLYFGLDYAILRKRASHTPGHRPTCLSARAKWKNLPDFCVYFLIFVFASWFSLRFPIFFTLCPNFWGAILNALRNSGA